MKYFILSFMLLIVVLGTLNSAWAGAKGYLCTVRAELHLNDDGMLLPYPNPIALGKQFAIDRRTGNLIEKAPSWWSMPGEKVMVLSNGNFSSNFVVTYVSPAADNGVFYTVLSVQEYASIEKKPFLLSSSSSVYAGFCE